MRLPVTGMRGLGLKCEKREKTERTGHATTGKKRKQARIDNMFAVWCILHDIHWFVHASQGWEEKRERERGERQVDFSFSAEKFVWNIMFRKYALAATVSDGMPSRKPWKSMRRLVFTSSHGIVCTMPCVRNTETGLCACTQNLLVGSGWGKWNTPKECHRCLE